MSPRKAAKKPKPAVSGGQPRGAAGSRLRFMSALIGDEEYALPLDRIYEVVPYAGLTRVPTAPAFIPGLVGLHGAAVPVIDLSRDLGAAPGLGQRSIVVVQIRIAGKPTLVGIAIDRLGRVLHVASEDVLPPPQLESLIAIEFLIGVVERAGRFILCVDVDRLLGADQAAQVAELAQQGVARAPAEPRVARLPFLCVRLAGEEYAVSLTCLQEITPCGPIAHIPGAAPCVLGATNVRGSIVPVVDVARRYGLPPTRAGAGSLLLLVDVAGEDQDGVGMLVESVERLVHVPADAVNRTPPFGVRFPAEVVVGMAPVNGAFVPILNTDIVLAEEDAAAAQAPPHPDSPPS